MTKQFEELDDAFNVTSEIVPTDTAEVGIISPEILKASFNSSNFLVIR